MSTVVLEQVCMFFFNDTATTEIYTLSLHDALPIYAQARRPGQRRGERLRAAHAAEAGRQQRPPGEVRRSPVLLARGGDRKSTRLNSSHANISYAVFCLKKTITISLSATISAAITSP